jgi:glycerophosphoryl diester phosphodiesterase
VTVQTLYHADGRELTVVRTQDVEPILEHNKLLRTLSQKSDWGRHRYSIPNVVLEKWLNEEWAHGNITMTFGSDEFYEMVERRMQDPDNKAFKVEAEFNGVLGFGS